MDAITRPAPALAAARTQHIARGVLTAHPLFIDRASGSHVWDSEGRRYLDFVGGIGVLNVGHNHPAVIAADEFVQAGSQFNIDVIAGHLKGYVAHALELGLDGGDDGGVIVSYVEDTDATHKVEVAAPLAIPDVRATGAIDEDRVRGQHATCNVLRTCSG